MPALHSDRVRYANSGELTACFRAAKVGISCPTFAGAVAVMRGGSGGGLPCGRAVHHIDRYSDKLDVAVAVPDQQLAATPDVLTCLVVNVAAATAVYICKP